MSTSTTPDTQALVQRYLAMWNEPAGDARRALVQQIVSKDATYVDPTTSVADADALSDLIGRVQEQFPGQRFTLHAGPDTHHDQLRFSWALGENPSAPTAVGTDIVELAADGRMARIVGFLEGAS